VSRPASEQPPDSGMGVEPVELADVAVDDALLDALGAPSPAMLHDPRDAAAMLLAGLRRDLDDEVAALLLRPTLTPLAPLTRPSRWQRRTAVAAVASLLALGGGGVAAAGPGDLLYPVRKAVAGPSDDGAAREIRDLLRRADADPAEATPLLDAAQHRLPAVGDSDRRASLAAEVARRHPPAPVPAPVRPTPRGGNGPDAGPRVPSPRPSPTRPSPSEDAIPGEHGDDRGHAGRGRPTVTPPAQERRGPGSATGTSPDRHPRGPSTGPSAAPTPRPSSSRSSGSGPDSGSNPGSNSGPGDRSGGSGDGGGGRLGRETGGGVSGLGSAGAGSSGPSSDGSRSGEDSSGGGQQGH